MVGLFRLDKMYMYISGIEIGLVFSFQSFSYNKLSSDTSLRIKYSAVTGVIYGGDQVYHCGRWFVHKPYTTPPLS